MARFLFFITLSIGDTSDETVVEGGTMPKVERHDGETMFYTNRSLSTCYLYLVVLNYTVNAFFLIYYLSVVLSDYSIINRRRWNHLICKYTSTGEVLCLISIS